MKCFFCDIQHAEDKQSFLETSNFFARFDDYPVNPGHCEIISKKHTCSFFELTNEDIAEVYSLLHEAKKIIDRKFNPQAYNVGVNDGVEAGRTIPHLHLHLIPRYTDDVPNPRGGIRHLIPAKADYVNEVKADPQKKDYFK